MKVHQRVTSALPYSKAHRRGVNKTFSQQGFRTTAGGKSLRTGGGDADSTCFDEVNGGGAYGGTNHEAVKTENDFI